jgi:geranylgeranyl diphosphate synthase, type II
MDICWVRALLERTGAQKYARTVAHALAGAALYEFDKYFVGVQESRDRSFMRNLLVWVLQRSH